MSDDVCRSYVIGLGANLGDRVGTLQSAVSALGRHGAVRAVSSLYESAAIGPPQPDYLNAAVLLESVLTPPQLLGALLGIEREHGRERRQRWGARTLDLDLLHSPGLVLADQDLTLPHPELARRAFALKPLTDVAADAREPQTGKLYRELLLALLEQDLRQLETRDWWRSGTVE
jgi:2-amino-4-hydroxy-6-hydroxymethyldihydropteridine diphosphokinase